MTKEERMIGQDYDSANLYTQKYIVTFLLQTQVRGMMIQKAARKLEEFTKLPAADSQLMRTLSVGWEALSIAVPACRFVKLIQAAETGKKIAEMSSAVRAVALVKPTTPGTLGKAYDGIGTGLEKGKAVYDVGKGAFGLSDPAPDGMEALSKLDTDIAAIKDLVVEAKKVVAAWSETGAFLIQEKYVRLELVSDKKPVPSPKSLVEMARLRLPELTMLEADDVETLGLEYLWRLISTYCRENVNFLNGAVRGLNNTQKDTILALFGFQVRRRGYFTRPAVPMAEGFLHLFGVPTTIPNYELKREQGHGRMRP